KDEDENSISTISTYSSKSFLKKQSTLSQYIEEVIIRICNLFEEVKKLNIRANCLVTDLARLYAAACRYLRNEMHDKVLILCFAHQANC
ncbi:12228_t:CDS:2, partial [Gigaspora margarita]